MSARRPRGTGSVRQVNGRWLGRWYIGRQRVERSLGPVRRPGSSEGLTKVQAEAKLRDLMAKTTVAPTAERSRSNRPAPG